MNLFEGITHYRKPYGVELELEFDNSTSSLPVFPDIWDLHHDGSLRGPSIELVTRGPRTLEEVRADIQELYASMSAQDRLPIESGRAGVHVHINVRGWDDKKLQDFLRRYFSVEEALLSFCGEERKHNNYCVSARDGNAIVPIAVAFCKEPKASRSIDRDKYSAMNLLPALRQGSIEFRGMRSVSSPEPLLELLDVLDALVNLEGTSEIPARELPSMVAAAISLSLSKADNFEGIKNTLEFDALMALDEVSIFSPTEEDDAAVKAVRMRDVYSIIQ